MLICPKLFNHSIQNVIWGPFFIQHATDNLLKKYKSEKTNQFITKVMYKPFTF